MTFSYDTESIYAALDPNPEIRIGDKFDNYNLLNQNSCFLLFDNCETNNIGFEDFIQLYAKEKNISIVEPIIEIYKIPYNNIFRKLRRFDSNSVSLFKYLAMNKISGKYLFNDFQGLKYDFNFFHQL